MPGVGQRTAQRMAFYILRLPTEEALPLTDAGKPDKKLLRAKYGRHGSLVAVEQGAEIKCGLGHGGSFESGNN